MGVDHTAGFFPESFQFFLAVIADVHDLRRMVNTVTVVEDMNHQLTQFISTGQQLRLFPGFIGVKEDKGVVFIVGFVDKADQVGLDLSGIFFLNPVYFLVARVRDLLGILRKFDLGDKFTALCILDRSEFINAAEGRPVFAGDQMSADAPGRNFTALYLQTVDQVFVKIVGSGNHSVRKAGFIEHLPGFFGQIGEVAAV